VALCLCGKINQMMNTTVDLDILKTYPCLEPEVGEELLLFYPDFLTADEKQQFETHLEGCEACQESLKARHIMEHLAHIKMILKQARILMEARRYDGAIALYNRVLEREPDLLDTSTGQEFFHSNVLFPVTTARGETKDLIPYIFPEYSPETYTLSASTTHNPFPLAVEYAHGKVKGTLTTAGKLIFFTLEEAKEEFEKGVKLVGKILHPATMLRVWGLALGKPERLGTIESLFGSPDFMDIARMLNTLRVFPG
jgi:tetratricopeptide (TPR) repeat protein